MGEARAKLETGTEGQLEIQDRHDKGQTKRGDRETQKRPASEKGCWRSKDGRQTLAVEWFVKRDMAERQGQPDPDDRRLPRTLSKGVSLPTMQGWQTSKIVPTPLPGSLACARCNSHRLETVFPSGVPQSQAEAITPNLGAIPVPP